MENSSCAWLTLTKAQRVEGLTLGFTFGLPTPAEATLEIYDVMGRRVARVASGPFSIGTSTVEWNPAGLGKGLYFGRLSSEGHSATIPVIIQ